MTRRGTAPTLRALIADLLGQAGDDVASTATVLRDVPQALAWESTQHGIDRIKGIQVAMIALGHLDILDLNTIEAYRTAHDHLTTARFAVFASGGGRQAEAINEVMVGTVKVMETFYLPAPAGSAR